MEDGGKRLWIGSGDEKVVMDWKMGEEGGHMGVSGYGSESVRGKWK